MSSLAQTSIKTLLFVPVRPLTFKEKKQVFKSKIEYENFVTETSTQEFSKVSAKLRSLNKTRRLSPELKAHANRVVHSNVNAKLAKLHKNITSKPPQNNQQHDRINSAETQLRQLKLEHARLLKRFNEQTQAFNDMRMQLEASLTGRINKQEFNALVPAPVTPKHTEQILFEAEAKAAARRQKRRAKRALKSKSIKESPTKQLKRTVAAMPELYCGDRESIDELKKFTSLLKNHPGTDAFDVSSGDSYKLIPSRHGKKKAQK